MERQLTGGMDHGKPLALALLTGSPAQKTSPIEVTWLADFFHSFPHVNLSFQLINPTFDPYNTSYQESLMFLASLPVLWMLLTMLVFIVYFCYWCYHTSESAKKQRSSKCLRWTIAVFVILTCASAGVGLYGNEEVRRGMNTFTESAAAPASDWNKAVGSVTSTVKSLEEVINHAEERGIKRLQGVFYRASVNETMRNRLRLYTSETQSNFSRVKEKVNSIEKEVAQLQEVTKTVKRTEEYEFYRWLGTLVLLCFFLLVCLIYLIAVAKGSKCLIIFCTCLGVFCLILSWTVIGIYLASAVAVGDFCVDPNGFVEREAERNTKEDKITPAVLFYYINCSDEVPSPFTADLKDAHDGLSLAERNVLDMNKLMLALFPNNKYNKKMKNMVKSLRKGVNRSIRFVQQLTHLVSCFTLHKSYVTALEGVCHTGLAGIAFLLLSNLAVALLITIIIVLASILWRRFGERKSYSTIDADDDPLTPRPQNSPSYHRYGSLNDVVAAYPSYTAHHTSPDQTSGGRFSPPSLRMPGSTRHTGPEHLPLHGRQTPPPAYGDYYEEYHHGMSTLGSRSGRRDPNGPVQV